MFASIADATAVARSGDVIQLQPGSYLEQVVLPGGVELRASIAGKAILTAPEGNDRWVAITAGGHEGGRIYGLRVESSPAAPVTIGVDVASGEWWIEAMEFEGAMTTGIAVASESTAVIRAAWFRGLGGPAIALKGGREVTIANSVFIREPGVKHPAVAMGESSNAAFTFNLFTGYGGDVLSGVSTETARRLWPVTSRSPMSLEGAMVGRYTVGRRLGRGSTGIVHEARNGEATVALKLVPCGLEDVLIDAETRGAQLQQAFGRAHGMVPEVYEIGQDDHYLYVAMELMTAPTLKERIASKPMSPTEAAVFARAICVVLEKLHTFTPPELSFEAVMHADLKPEHVFVLADATVKLYDFGTAKGLEREAAGTAVVGLTPQYAPPERFTERRARVGDDLWAVGVMLYEMVAGHRPHSRKEGNERHLQQAIELNEPREPLPPGCPQALAAIIDQLLKFQREHRFENAAAIRTDLDDFLAGREPSALKTVQHRRDHQDASAAGAAPSPSQIRCRTSTGRPAANAVPPRLAGASDAGRYGAASSFCWWRSF